tara:strand:- start:867 stop:1472 length:606 start_codon:yes stop_codon:yes gene_type:complete
MSKIELDDVKSGYNLGKMNANFNKIKDLIDGKVLMRDNTEHPNEPNHMEQELDMNSYRIINVGKPELPSDAARLQDIPFGIGIDNELIIKSQSEEVVLADGQVTVTFTTLSTVGAVFQINGPSVDSRNLIDIDFVGTTDTTVTLAESYPAGTVLTMWKNSGKTPSDTITQQPPIVDSVGGDEQAKINEILTALRASNLLEA